MIGPSRFVLVLLFALMFVAVAVAVEPSAEPEDAVEAAQPTIRVALSFGLAIDRETRSLVSPQEHFAAENFSATEGRVYCLSRVQNMSPPATLTHVWYHEGKTMARVDLPIGSADWRTWSSKRILPAWTGQWEVKVLDDSGMVLATSGFVVD